MTGESFYLHQKFRDFDEFCENALNWDLDYRQLEAGNFSSELLMFGNESTLFTHAKIERRLLQKGTAPQDLITFGVLADPGINIHWRNIDISGNKLFIFPPGGELFGITQADFDVFVISLPEPKLDQVCASFELPELRKLVAGHEVFACEPRLLDSFRSRLRQREREITGHSGTINQQLLLQQLESELADYLIRLLAGCNQSVGRGLLRKRDLALKSAEDYIHESANEVVTIPELCNASNASQRTLEYAFRERYGLTPKEYTLIYRLNNVRKQLRQAVPVKDQVSRIAQQHGFWHMGQFSASYRKLFAELPSETLKQIR